MNRKFVIGLCGLMCTGILGAGIALNNYGASALETKAGVSAETIYRIDISEYDAWKGVTEGFNLWAWDDNTQKTVTNEWPGDPISSSSISNNVITITIPKNTKAFLINLNSKQTTDIYCCDIAGATYLLDGNEDDKGNLTGAWEATNDGWYIIGSSTNWKINLLNKQTSTPDGYLAKWSGVSFAEGEKMQLVKVVGSWINNDYWQDWNRVNNKAEINGYARNEDSSEKPNIYFSFTGTYDISLNNAYEITINPTDQTVVNKFVSDYFTVQMAESYAGKDAETRVADCKTKYDAAHDAYESLTPAQKTLFSSEAVYAPAREAYSIWETSAKKEEPSFVYQTSLSRDNQEIAVTVAIISLTIATFSGFLFLRKKEDR